MVRTETYPPAALLSSAIWQRQCRVYSLLSLYIIFLGSLQFSSLIESFAWQINDDAVFLKGRAELIICWITWVRSWRNLFLASCIHFDIEHVRNISRAPCATDAEASSMFTSKSMQKPLGGGRWQGRCEALHWGILPDLLYCTVGAVCYWLSLPFILFHND